MRNSSLVKRSCAEDVTGLKPNAEAARAEFEFSNSDGRGAFHGRRRSSESTAGACGSENAGMSSVMHVRNVHTVCLRFPEQG